MFDRPLFIFLGRPWVINVTNYYSGTAHVFIFSPTITRERSLVIPTYNINTRADYTLWAANRFNFRFNT